MTSIQDRQLRGGVAIVLFVALVLIALYVRDGVIRPLGGDFLVVMFLYFAARAALGLSRIATGVLVFVFAAAVEVSQGLGLVERLGLEGNQLAVTVLGATFDPIDIVAYGLGTILAAALDRP